MGALTKNTALTVFVQAFRFLLAAFTSIIIARFLGPENKGLYSLALLVPTLLVAFTNVGVPQATAFYVAKRLFNNKVIFGNNILISVIIGLITLMFGIVFVIFFQDTFLPNVPKSFVLLALLAVPLNLLASNLKNILLGLQRIVYFNLADVVPQFLNFLLILILFLFFQSSVTSIISVLVLTSLISSFGLLMLLKKIVGGVSFKLNRSYLKKTLLYGIKSHLGKVVIFLNYRLDLFLVNGFLNPISVGLYSISVSLAERLWILSGSASTILFPRIASGDKKAMEEHTPLVSRNILWITALGALILYITSGWLIPLLYSSAFLASVKSLQILLIGIVALSPARVLSGDISGRGYPLQGSIVNLITLVINIILNLIWIPRFGIEGAAWATSVSYSATLVGQLYIYNKISGISIYKVLIPQKADLQLYKKLAGYSYSGLMKVFHRDS